MKALTVSLVCAAALVACEGATGSDLELTIRPHAREVVFGDPVFVEVKIYNRGKEAVKPDYYHGDRFRFEIRDNETDMIIWRLDADGQPSPNKFEAGDTAFFHQYVFFPGLQRFNHPFWKPMRDGRSVAICGVYLLDARKTELRSHWHEIHVVARDEEEMQVLEHWARPQTIIAVRGPTPGDLGLQLRRILNKDQTLELASKVKSGELSDLLQLSVQLQELYALTRDDDRGPANRNLVAWLQEQPDIKRQALTKEARSIAEAYNMRTTVQALEPRKDPK